MSKFKVVPTPDHGTRLAFVPADEDDRGEFDDTPTPPPNNSTPATDEEWLKAACEHDITYGEDPTSPPVPHLMDRLRLAHGKWAMPRIAGLLSTDTATCVSP